MRGSEDRERRRRRRRRRGPGGDLSFSPPHFGLHPGGFVGSGIGLSGVTSVLCGWSAMFTSLLLYVTSAKLNRRRKTYFMFQLD